MGTKCNQDAYAYLTQACAIAIEYLHQIDLAYVPGKRDKVVASIKSKQKKAKRAQNTKVEKFTSTNNARDEIAAAEKLCKIYFDIAASCIGEDAVRQRVAAATSPVA